MTFYHCIRHSILLYIVLTLLSRVLSAILYDTLALYESVVRVMMQVSGEAQSLTPTTPKPCVQQS